MDREEQWYEWPEWAKDAVVTDVQIHLSIRDAIRLLWKRHCSVESKTFTAEVVGRTSSVSRISIPSWREKRHDQIGVIDSA